MTEVRTWHGAWRPFALAFATVGVVALLALAGVRWVVWPNLDWFRPAIEAWLRATVGVPIALGGCKESGTRGRRLSGALRAGRCGTTQVTNRSLGKR
jgi:hypothetical protein